MKLAIIVILLLVASLATGTFMESAFDTPTSQFWVYRSFWFKGILFTLGLNILCVALSRLPWKKRHTPFLLAHAGILILLFGSWVTDKYGLDGSLRVSEGETGTVVDINAPTLQLSDETQTRSIPIQWTPVNATFSPVVISDYGLTVDQFITHADPLVSFVSTDGGDTAKAKSGFPAVHLKIEGGLMKISQDFWLWGGDPNWSVIQAGPARLSLKTDSAQAPSALQPSALQAGMGMKGPEFEFAINAAGGIDYTSKHSDGKVDTGKTTPDKIIGQVIQTGWKGNPTIKILEWIPHAVTHTTYKPSKMQTGDMAPTSAIHLVVGKTSSSRTSETWLGLGDRAVLDAAGKEVAISYMPKRVVLPFGIKLERFTIEHYEGTHNPSSYSSLVSVKGSKPGEEIKEPRTISMNEPLEHGGITFYQASYEDANPRPVTSIFSVNRDPGRRLKYFGSFLLVFGTILLFGSRYVKNSKNPKQGASSSGSRADSAAEAGNRVTASAEEASV